MYNKLFAKILDSSIWLQPSATRIVWMTFIAVMDEDGFVQFASVGNVAQRAVVTLDEAQVAIACLEAPDPESSDPANDGRRVERVPGGWIVLNAQKHRDMVTRAVIKEQTRERVKRHRDKVKRSSNAEVTPSVSVSVSGSGSDTGAPLAMLAVPARVIPLVSMREHRSHALCGRPCLPAFLFADFVSLKGGREDEADREVRAWANGILDEWAPDGPKADEPIGDDPLKFWRLRFREWQGTTAKPALPPGPRQMTDDEIWADIEQQNALRKARR